MPNQQNQNKHAHGPDRKFKLLVGGFIYLNKDRTRSKISERGARG